MNKPISMRELEFKNQLRDFRKEYGQEILDEFFNYWTEPNKSNTRMKFELEKTWHLGRRLARWAANSKIPQVKTKPGIEAKSDPANDFERLDEFIALYKMGKVKFEDHGKWYDFMKENKLLKQLTKGDVDTLIRVYNNDKVKCRCAVVMDTLSGYVNNNLRVVDIMDLRARLCK